MITPSRTSARLAWLGILLAAAFLTAPVWADDGKPSAPPAATQPAAAPTASAATPTPEQVTRELLEKRQAAPAIEPTRRPVPAPVSAGNAPGASSVLGVAPGMPQPQLHREGEFIVNRRCRVTRAPNGSCFLLVFDADSEKSPEPPVILEPCQMTQSMEDQVQENGDKVVFIVSGQIFTYRGANYLLPTMRKIAVDQGNLQH